MKWGELIKRWLDPISESFRFESRGIIVMSFASRAPLPTIDSLEVLVLACKEFMNDGYGDRFG